MTVPVAAVAPARLVWRALVDPLVIHGVVVVGVLAKPFAIDNRLGRACGVLCEIMQTANTLLQANFNLGKNGETTDVLSSCQTRPKELVVLAAYGQLVLCYIQCQVLCKVWA